MSEIQNISVLSLWQSRRYKENTLSIIAPVPPLTSASKCLILIGE